MVNRTRFRVWACADQSHDGKGASDSMLLEYQEEFESNNKSIGSRSPLTLGKI